MGGGVSLPKSNDGSDVAIHVYPIYYIPDAVVTENDANNANNGWNLITGDKAPGYLKVRKLDDGKTALTYFYERFYNRLFTAHPSCIPLFKNNIAVQGKALVHMIGAATSLLRNLGQLVPALQDLARRHSVSYKVMGNQYGVVGEVLIATLAEVLGEYWNDDHLNSWMKIYSVMLSVIIPVAIQEERKKKNVPVPRDL